MRSASNTQLCDMIVSAWNDIEPKIISKQAIGCAVLQRRNCIGVLSALKLDLLYFSPTQAHADSQIPKLFAELLVL